MVTGLVVDGSGFEVLVGDERVGSRRAIEPADVEFLTGLAGPVCAGGAGGFAMPGCSSGWAGSCTGWLDGDQGQLGGLLERAGPAAGVRGGGAAVAVGGGVGGAAGPV